MLPSSIHRRTYILITVIVSLPMLLWAFYQAYSGQKYLLQHKEREMIFMATLMEQKLLYSYEPLLSIQQSSQISDKEKSRILHRHLQPIVEEMANTYPGYGIGYHSTELDMVAAVSYNQEMAGQNSYDFPASYQMEVSYTDKEITHTEQGTIDVAYPVFYEGKLIGHVVIWCSIAEVNKEVAFFTTREVGIIFFIWLATVLTIRWAFWKIDKSLNAMVSHFSGGCYKDKDLLEFPQMIPVLDTIYCLKEDLKKEYEEKEQIREEMARWDRLNLVSQMAAGVAHEIRNPMTVIMGYIQMIMQKAESANKEKLMVVMDELKRVNEIITDFLTLARSKTTLMERISLNQIIEQLQPLLYAESMRQGVTIRMELCSNMPLATFDVKEIKQLILNLTRNAIEAMAGRGTLTMITFANAKTVGISIIDTGCGMTEEQMVKMFDPFFTTKAEGTGLGLSVCKSIVERHHGEIIVQSSEGAGTTFDILFSLPNNDASSLRKKVEAAS